MKIDLLRIVVLTPTFAASNGVERERYASANAISDHGRYGGAKSEEYLALFRAVREAARAEMAAIGWTTWAHGCDATVVRYHRTLVVTDAPNLGKIELDALEPSNAHEDRRDGAAPFAGVFENDRQIRGYHATTEYDPEGPDRVLITVRRRYPDAIGATSTQRPKKAPRARAVAQPRSTPPDSLERAPQARGDERLPVLNGRTISFAEAAKLIAAAPGIAADERIRGRRQP